MTSYNPWGNLKGGGTWTNPPTQASDDDDADDDDGDDDGDDEDDDDGSDDGDDDDDDDDHDNDGEINADTERISFLRIDIDGNYFLNFFLKKT